MNIKFILFSLLFLVLSGLSHADSFHLATSIEKKGSTVSVSSERYLKLTVVKFQTNTKGTIHLNGIVQVNQGVANIVMWSKVKGSFYFSKLPSLQKIRGTKPIEFSIPFSSPNDIITEVVLEVELPQGGKVTFDQLSVTKG